MVESNALHHRQWLTIAGAAAVLVGAIVSILATLGPAPAWGIDWQGAFLLVGYMLAAMAIAGVVGFIFGVPRAKAVSTPGIPSSESDKTKSLRFEANSNLEQISDWLTKILVGAGLVQIAAVPGFLATLGTYLGVELGPAGPQIALAIVLYGVGVGFLLAYLWSRLRLRVLVEIVEADAQDESVRDAVVRDLSLANQNASPAEEPDKAREIAKTAEYAEQVAQTVSESKAVLWVDDQPRNNTDLVRTMRSLGIDVRIAMSTEEAIPQVTAEIGLIITDLRRVESGQDVPLAGLQLIKQVRADGNQQFIIVYTGRRGIENRQLLLDAGANFVTSSPSACLREALGALVGTLYTSR